MKITTEHEYITTESLNKALKALCSVFNQHFVASGNKIKLEEKEDNYDSHKSKFKNMWVIKLTVEWVKKSE